MELNINVNVTFQRNKLLSLSGYYKGEYMSAPEYTSISDLNGAGFHGGYNHIVYQMVGHAFWVFFIYRNVQVWFPMGMAAISMRLRT